MKTFAFSDLNRQSGEVLDAAMVEPVTLHKRGKPRLVMMSIGAYEKLARNGRAYTIESAPRWVDDELRSGIEAILSDRNAAEAG